MAGAMSEQGKPLKEMAEFLREAVKDIGMFLNNTMIIYSAPLIESPDLW